MKHLLSLLILSTACVDVADDPEDGIDDTFVADGKGDAAGIAEGTPEAIGILKVANRASFQDLDVTAKLSSRAAANIVKRRAGADGVDGTADDKPFATLTELDAVSYVGPVAVDQMLAYARTKGWVVAPGTLPTCTGTPKLPTTGPLVLKTATRIQFERSCDAFGVCTLWAHSATVNDQPLLVEDRNEIAPTGAAYLTRFAFGPGGAFNYEDYFSTTKTQDGYGASVQLDKVTGIGHGIMDTGYEERTCGCCDCTGWYQHPSFDWRPVTVEMGATCLSIGDDDPATDYGAETKKIIVLGW